MIALRQQQIRDALAQRRLIDERFDPRAALFAQTRYLIWMWTRYPSVDWVFQAYHGGEEGVQRLLQNYLGPRWTEAGSVTHAIAGENREGKRVGSPLSYADVFFNITPRAYPAAFSYLYGLKDEHRTYWFKLLMAEKAMDWYRRDPKSFRNEWEALRPGYPIEDAWYPNVEDQLYPNAEAAAAAQQAGVLKPLSAVSLPGVQLATLDFLPAAEQTTLAAVRPEVLGALAVVSRTYREQSTHPVPLVVVSMTQPLDLVAQIRARYPLLAPKTPTPASVPSPASLPDMHAAGLALDVLKPTDPWEAKVLEYALGYWEDRERIHFNTESWGKVQAWRITPNPLYRPELTGALKG